MSQPGKGDIPPRVGQITPYIGQSRQKAEPVDKILLGSVRPISYGRSKAGEQSPSENSPARAGSIVTLVVYPVRLGVAVMHVGECNESDR